MKKIKNVNTTILSASNLNFKTKDRVILKDVNFQFYSNTIYGIIGTNGSGKTTLASVIMGLGNYSDYTGNLFLGKTNINKMDITDRAKLGIKMAWQEPARFEGISIYKYLEISLPAESRKDKKKIDDSVKRVLKTVGLSPKRYQKRILDKTLSGGERKRIELASMILSKAKVAILDEPDSGIDLDSIPYITDSIKRLKNANTCVIIITHNKAILQIVDHVYVMKKGVLKRAESE